MIHLFQLRYSSCKWLFSIFDYISKILLIDILEKRYWRYFAKKLNHL